MSLEDIQSAEKEIIKSVQEGYFKDEIEALKKKQRLKASSCIIRLDPFMDSKGLLRVGGRICKSALEKNIQHPILNSKILQDHTVNHRMVSQSSCSCW